MYHHFNVQKLYVLPTQCIDVFFVDLRTNSYYFPIQHWLIGFYNRDGVCLLRHCSEMGAKCLRRSFAGFLSRKLRFDSKIFHTRFVVDKALGKVFLVALPFSTVSIIPPLLHTHSFIYHPRYIMFFLPVLQFSPVSIIPLLLRVHSSTVAVTRRTNDRSLWNIQNWNSLSRIWEQKDREILPPPLFSKRHTRKGTTSTLI
jgi:hypothetical protein